MNDASRCQSGFGSSSSSSADVSNSGGSCAGDRRCPRCPFRRPRARAARPRPSRAAYGSSSRAGGSSVSIVLPSSSNRLGQRPHVRHAFATGSLTVPHCEQRQGASATAELRTPIGYGAVARGISTSWIREPSSAESSKTTQRSDVVEVAGREVERPPRAGARGRGHEVLVDDVPVVVEHLVVEVRLERVRGARRAERARHLLERKRRLDEDRRRLLLEVGARVALARRSRRTRCSGNCVSV